MSHPISRLIGTAGDAADVETIRQAGRLRVARAIWARLSPREPWAVITWPVRARVLAAADDAIQAMEAPMPSDESSPDIRKAPKGKK